MIHILHFNTDYTAYIRRCLKQKGIDSELITPEEIENHSPEDILLMDACYTKPFKHFTGLKFLNDFRKIHPNNKVVLMSWFNTEQFFTRGLLFKTKHISPYNLYEKKDVVLLQYPLTIETLLNSLQHEY